MAKKSKCPVCKGSLPCQKQVCLDALGMAIDTHKYTSGPWELVEDTIGRPVIMAENRDTVIAFVNWPGMRSLAVLYANGQLMSASPDMFDALKEFVSHYPSGINPDLDRAYRKALGAIQKVEERKWKRS